MEKQKFNSEKTKTAMLIKWIDGLSFLSDKDKTLLLQIAFVLKDNRKEAFRLYDEISEEEEHSLSLNGEILKLNKEQKIMILSTLIDFSEQILPLGTVVVLKEDFFKNDKDEEIKIIISNRFLANEKSGVYFTYGGTIYPSGTFGEDKILSFNSQCIDKVIHKGYSDETDEAYVLVMKNEVVLKKGIHSINFADKNQQEIFKEETSK